MTEPLPYAPPPPPEPKRPPSRTPLWAVGLFLLTVIDWFAWLGWDTRYDTAPDGSASGPYQAWQVVGLVAVLLVATCYVLLTRRAPTVIIVPIALTLSVSISWSSTDSSGLWGVGAAMVLIGSALACAFLAAICVPIGHASRAAQRRETASAHR